MTTRLFAVLTAIVILSATVCIGATSCTNTPTPTPKTSQALLLQVELRKQQIAAPTEERLAQMKSMGMVLDNLKIQRVFIYMNDMPTSEQEKDFEEMGIKFYVDSWVPPMSNHPSGFFIAQMPFDKLGELASKEYVVKLDTAERENLPRCGLY